MNLILFIFIVLLGFTSYYFGRKKAYTIQSTTKKRLTALPQFYGYYLAIWCAIPAFIIYSLWAIFEPTIVKLLILSDYANQGYLDDELNLIYEKTKALSRGQFTGEVTSFYPNIFRKIFKSSFNSSKLKSCYSFMYYYCLCSLCVQKNLIE